MAWPNNRTHIRWPLYQRFLAIACIITFIPLTIAVLVVVGLIPVYLSNDAAHITRSTSASPFNVTYLLVDQSTELNLNSVDRIKMARSFEHGLGLNIRNILQIDNIFSNAAIINNSKSRRKRLVQCDPGVNGMSGPVLIFNFNLTYPINRICQSQECVNKTFAEVYKQFQSVPSLSIDFLNVTRELRLCSFGVLPYSAVESAGTVTSTVSNTQSPITTVFSSRGGSHTTTPASNLKISSTQIPLANESSTTTTVHISSTNTPLANGLSTSATVDISSTKLSVLNGSSTTTTTAVDISSTRTPGMNISSTINISSTETSVTTVSLITETTIPTESSTPTSNETNLDIDACLKKLPMTQEQVPPYRITHTSTLFFQDDHSLIVVGASKFETIINMQTTKREIVIDGIPVYTNCQRTFEVSLPYLYLSC